MSIFVSMRMEPRVPYSYARLSRLHSALLDVMYVGHAGMLSLSMYLYSMPVLQYSLLSDRSRGAEPSDGWWSTWCCATSTGRLIGQEGTLHAYQT